MTCLFRKFKTFVLNYENMQNNCRSVSLVGFLVGFKVTKFMTSGIRSRPRQFEKEYLKINNFLPNFSYFQKFFILMLLLFDIE